MNVRLLFNDSDDSALGGAGGDVSDSGTGLKDDPNITKYTSVEELAKGHVNAAKSIGNNVAIPGKDEDWGPFWDKIGRPPAADQYELPEVEGADQLSQNPDDAANYAKKAHELGLTQRQMAGLWQHYQKSAVEYMNGFQEQQAAENQQGQLALQKEWGQAYDQKLSEAQAAVKEFGSDELVNLLNDTGFGDHPVLIKAFASIGEAMRNDKMYGRGDDMRSGALSPGMAQQEIADLNLNAEFMNAYMNGENAGHAEAVKKMQALMRIAYPDEQ